MAKRSGSNSIPFWGTFAAAANLPNVAASPTQTPQLEAGDQAYVSGVPGFFVCTTATLGAAVWTQLSAGAFGLLTEYTFRPSSVPNHALGIYDNWTELMTATALQRAAGAPFTISVDLSIAGVSTALPAGAWALGGSCRWRGENVVSGVNLQIDAGQTTFTGLLEVTENLVVESGNGPWLSFPSGADFYLSRKGQLVTDGTSGLVVGAGNTFNLYISEGGFVYGTPTIRLGNGAVLNIHAVGTDQEGVFSIGDSTIEVPAGAATILANQSPGAFISTNQPAFVGTFTLNATMLQYAGGVWRQTRTITHSTGAVALDPWDADVNVDTSTGTISDITLPNTVPPPGHDRVVTIRDIGGAAQTNTVKIKAPGGGTVDGGASATLPWPLFVIRLRTSDGVNYTSDTDWGAFPIYFKFAGGGNQGTTLYQTDSSGNSIATTPVSYPVIRDVHMRRLEIWVRANTLNTAPGVSFTVYKNGVATALTLSVAAGSTGSFAVNDNVDFTAGDRIDLVTVATAGTGAFSFGAHVYGWMLETSVIF